MLPNKYKPNLEFNVEEDIKLLDFLFKKIINKSKNNIKSLLARGNVLVNGNAVTKYDYELKKGYQVLVKIVQIHDDRYDENLDIIYEDNDLIVINKPYGLLSISTEDEKNATAYKMVMNYVKSRNHGSKIFVIHRLDKETSGIIIFAKNERIKHAFQDDWDKLVTIRGYIAVVEGKLEKTSDTIESWLKETTTMLVYSSNRMGDGKKAITHYQVTNSNAKYSLLSIKIDTGRKNQIRVHMKDIGHSVIGDRKYGAKTNPIGRLGLHANILEFKHPITNKIMHFETDIPIEFKTLFK